VLDAVTGKFPETGRYPFNSTPNDGKLVETIAALHKAKPENVVESILGREQCGQHTQGNRGKEALRHELHERKTGHHVGTPCRAFHSHVMAEL
jgi:hypothetical protein